MGVVGRKPGSHGGFAYSPAMTDFGAKHAGLGPTTSIDEFLKARRKHLPGTKMTFVGLKKPEERINLIAYLHAQGHAGPAPDPSRRTRPLRLPPPKARCGAAAAPPAAAAAEAPAAGGRPA